LNWDIRDLESRGSKLEKERAKLGKDQLHALKEYTNKSQDEQDRIRGKSQTQSISIVTTILKDAKLSSTELTEVHHTQALEYLSIHLSIRDRKQLIQILCKSNPDYLTMSVREVVDAYEPVIRRMHKAVDLSSTLGDFQNFLSDMIKLGRIPSDKSGHPVVPTVGDFVQLLRKHQKSTHVFMHQCAKNDKELTGWYLDWAKKAASQFKQEETTSGRDSTHGQGGAGKLTPALHKLFTSLPRETQMKIKPILDSHSTFLEEMHHQSMSRLVEVLKSPPSKSPTIAKIFTHAAHHSSRPTSRTASPAPTDRHGLASGASTPHSATFPPHVAESETSREIKEQPTPHIVSNPGPGAFLARWQALLDATPITPLSQHGSLKAASSPEVVQNSATDVDGSKLVEFASKEAKGEKLRVEDNTADDESGGGKDDQVGIGNAAKRRQRYLRVVIDALGKDFRDLLAKEGCYW
jgi:hypothetical protein